MNFSFVDRILAFEPGKYTIGLKHITASDDYLTRDYQDQSILLPCIMGEALGQLCSWNVIKSSDFRLRLVGGVVGEVRMFANAYVGDTILLENTIDSLDFTNQAVSFHGRASVGGKTLLTVTNGLGPLLPLHEFSVVEQVQTQFAMLYRPQVTPAHDGLHSQPAPTSCSDETAPAIGRHIPVPHGLRNRFGHTGTEVHTKAQNILFTHDFSENELEGWRRSGAPTERACEQSGVRRRQNPERKSLKIMCENYTAYDAIISWEKGKAVVAQKNLSLVAPYFTDHFPKKPVMPLSLLLECNLQLAYSFVGELVNPAQRKELWVQAVKRIKMSDFVLPGDSVITKMTLKENTETSFIINFRNEVDNKRVCIAEAEFIIQANYEK